ncbi:MAG: DUF4038 domain-containing protein [bacterium]
MEDDQITRRQFIQASTAGTAGLGLVSMRQPAAAQGKCSAERNCVVEIELESSQDYADPYNQVELDIELTCPGGEKLNHPGFWAGGSLWKARVALSQVGEYTYRTICSNTQDSGLHDRRGVISVKECEGENSLVVQGRLRVAEDRRHFEHTDGTPFFWVGDTWWMGLCSRLDFPKGFEVLTDDRKTKGFNVVQIVAGPYPDMDSWDPRGANEAGFSFTDNYQSINPQYYDLADRKVEHLVHSGIVPCIVGMWGYYLPRIGVEKAKRFWRYLTARYGAYPVVWCMAGEGVMPYYLSEAKKEESAFQKTGWTEVTEYVKDIDGFHNLITIHPTQYGREMVDNPALLDFEMLQTGHSDLDSISNTAQSVIKSVDREPRMPVIVAEVNYEGILGRCWQNIQRLSFYSAVLNGAVGHTYGANGIWQMSTPGQPYGKSPHGRSWGNTPWQEAYQFPGSKQIGAGGRLMQRFQWWRLERHPEWVDPPCDPTKPYSSISTGIPGDLRIIYVPLLWDPPRVQKVEPDVHYEAYYFDPVEGEDIPIGEVKPDNKGEWKPPLPPEVHDWVLVMKAK